MEGVKEWLDEMVTKGVVIGVVAGILKIMQDVRVKSFKWHIAITDLFASSVVGYSVYEWASEAKSLHEWQIIMITVILSLNAFLVVKILTDPKMITLLIRGWLKSNVNTDEITKDADSK